MTIPWSINEFSQVLAGPGNRRLAMLVAYFDESGTAGEQAEVTAIAGLVGTTKAWARLESSWRKRLGPIPWFHVSACDAGVDHFAKVPDHKNLYNDLIDQIAKSEGLAAIGGAVYRDDWNYGAKGIVKKVYGSRYHLCVTMVLLALSQLSKEQADGEPIAIVFAKQDQYNDHTVTIHEVFYQSREWKQIGSLTFADPRLVIPLQVADLFSLENYRELLGQLKTPGLKRPIRDQLASIYESIPAKSQVATIEFIHAYGEGLDEFNSSLSRPLVPSA